MSADKPTTADEGWSAAKLAAAQVIANGGRYADAGEVVSRDKRTVARWMADPAFARLVGDLRAERLAEITGQMTELAPQAVAVIREALQSDNPPTQLRAAQLALEWTLRLRRAGDLEVRVLEIERAQGIRTNDTLGLQEVAS